MEGQTSILSSVEFVVDEEQTPLLRDSVHRIEELFNVAVDIGKSFKVPNSVKRWLTIESEGSSQEEIERAKTYCLAIACPERIVTRGRGTFITKQDKDRIERESTAFMFLRNGEWEIQGTDLCVAIAESMIDDNVRSLVRPQKPRTCSDDCAIMEQKISQPNHSPNVSNSFNPCNKKLLSNTEGTCPKELEAMGTRSSFQTIKENDCSTEHISSRLKSSQARTESPMFPGHMKGGFPRSVTDVNNHSNRDFSHFGIHKDSSIHYRRISLSQVDQVPPLSYSNFPHKQMSMIEEQRLHFKNLAESYNFDPEDIERALNTCDFTEVIRPADFLDRVKKNKERRHGKGLQPVFHLLENPHVAPVSHLSPSSRPMSHTSQDTNVKGGECDLTGFVIVSSDEAGNVYDFDPVDEQRVGFRLTKEVSPLRNENDRQKHQMDMKISADRNEGPQRNIQSPQLARQNRLTQRTAQRNRLPEQSAEQNRLPRQRYIIIDGSNVAMCHGNNQVFSVPGIQICINHFLEKGHQVTAFVPESKRYFSATNIVGQPLLEKLNKDGVLKFTPARRVNGKVITSYDDRFILNLAEKEDGIVVSNDQFRDLVRESASYKEIIQSRLLPFVFVGDHFMPPDDPLGRNGPTLEQFLCFPPPPSRSRSKSRKKRNRKPLTANHVQKSPQRDFTENNGCENVHQQAESNAVPKNRARFENAVIRGPDETRALFDQLQQLFPDPSQAACIWKILENHKDETDVMLLSNYCLSAFDT